MADGFVQRFSAYERIVHWLHVAAFSVLVVTGLFLYVPVLQPYTIGEAGQASRLLHRIAAVVFFAGPFLYMFLEPRRFAENVRESLTWGPDDLSWLRYAWGYYTTGEKGQMAPQGKFNTGQKLNNLVQIVGFGVLVATGCLMWFGKGAVPVALFQWSVILHVLMTIVMVTFFLVHLHLVLVNVHMRESMTGMVTGMVPEEFAAEHHPKWLDQLKRKAVG